MAMGSVAASHSSATRSRATRAVRTPAHAEARPLNPQPEPPGVTSTTTKAAQESAWPNKLEIGALKAGASEVLM